jgi:hypothetical protein
VNLDNDDFDDELSDDDVIYNNTDEKPIVIADGKSPDQSVLRYFWGSHQVTFSHHL